MCLVALSATLALPDIAPAQNQPTPVYLDDSPSAEEAIARAKTLAANNILDEAARVLHRVIDEQGDFVATSPTDPDLYISVRELVHRTLRENPALLDRYITLFESRASALVRLGDIETVERSYLLTPAGLEAALRVAQDQLEHAAFEASALTLERLQGHPSLDAENALSAAELAELVWAYLPPDSPNVARMAQLVGAWRALAGNPPGAAPKPIDGPAMITSVSPYSTLDEPTLAGVLPKPTASARLGETPEIVRQLAAGNSNRSLPNQSRVLNSMPAIAGDMVLTNDSETMTAFDRFTLAQRWRVTLVAPMVVGGSRYAGLEDPNLVAVSDPYAVGLMGVSQLGRSARERVLAAVDVRSGDLVWQRTLPELGIPTLRDGLMRGPVVIDEGVVAVSVVRIVSEHRLMSVSMVGFELATGSLRWVRPLGSIGFVAWAMNPEVIDAGTSSGGVVYRGDRVGMVAAIEMATGRVRWVRRMTRSFEPQPGTAEPWEGNTPVLVGDRLFTLTPDRLRIAQLDAATGAQISTVSALDFGSPTYLVSFDGMLAGVTRYRIKAAQIDPSFPAGIRTPVEIGTFERNEIRGRVMSAGDALVAPTPQGITVVRASIGANGAITPSRTDIPLDAPGNAMIAPGQIVIADDDRVHSYLSWETASSLLRARIDSSPDPSPAVTYAELAYRAAQDQVLVASVDAAVQRIEADPLADAGEAARARLFESVMDMVEPRAQRQLGGPLGDTTRNALVERLMRIAATPTERVSALLATGRMHETLGAPARAVERYQEILSSPVLAQAAYSGGSTRVPAEVEAVRRLRNLVGVEGRGVYAAYDAELDRLLIERAASTDAAVFTALASRYPVALRASTAWLEAARRWRASGNPREAVRALEEGLTAARETGSPSDPVFGELAGTLVRSLADAGRYLPAARVLEDLAATRGHAPLTVDGVALDEQTLTARITSELAARSRRPRIGTEFGEVTLMAGYTLAMPVNQSSEGMPADVVLLESMNGLRSLWRADPNGGLRMVWETLVSGDVVRIDHEAVYFSELRSPRMAERTITRVSIRTGEAEWTTPTFTSMFSERDPFQNITGGPPLVETPLERNAPLTDLIALFEPDTLVLVERTGRIAAVDIGTGQPLWSSERSRARVDMVHDAASGDGLVVIGGTKSLPPTVGGGLERAASDTVVVIDARTGEPTFEYEETTPIRWVRIGDDGRVIVGFDSGVACLDAVRRAVVWRNDMPTVAETVQGWAVSNGVVVRNFDNFMFLLDGRTGTADDAPLPVGDRLEAGVAMMELAQVPGGNLVIGTDRGVVLLDRTGALVGADASEFGHMILLPEVAEGAIVTVGQHGNPVDEGLSSYRVGMYDTRSVKALRDASGLVLGAVPREMRLIDNRILVAAGSVVAVIDAPAGDAPLPQGVPALPIPQPTGLPPVPVPRETPEGGR